MNCLIILPVRRKDLLSGFFFVCLFVPFVNEPVNQLSNNAASSPKYFVDCVFV